MTLTPRENKLYRDGILLGSVCGGLMGAALGAAATWVICLWVYWS